MGTISRITVEHLYEEIHSAAERAAPLFRLYGWTYGLNGGDGIPTHNDLVNTITELAEHALEHFYRSEEEFRTAQVGSGRFVVSVNEYEDEVCVNIRLELGERTWFKAQPKY